MRGFLSHITAATYFRIYLSEFVAPSVQKVIYLDSDMIVRHNILALWNTDISDFHLAAVPDPYSDLHTKLGFAFSDTYFNAGALVINVARWRADNVQSRLVAYIDLNKEILHYHDQDAINVVLKDNIRCLDYTWNFQARLGSLPYWALSRSKGYYKSLKRDPSIVHYTGPIKPWVPSSVLNYRELYFQILEQTPWCGEACDEKSIMGFVLRVSQPKNLRRIARWRAPEMAWSVLYEKKLRQTGPIYSFHLKMLEGTNVQRCPSRH
jgi:lipopolysaccharide biosynthesis glycosyltransferase